MISLVIVFGISILCAAGACSIWEKTEKCVKRAIKKRNDKKEMEQKRALAKDVMREFCRAEKNRILIRETFIWGNELDSLHKEREKKLEGRGYFEKF